MNTTKNRLLGGGSVLPAIGRMTPRERAMGRYLRGPDDHPPAGPGTGEEDEPKPIDPAAHAAPHERLKKDAKADRDALREMKERLDAIEAEKEQAEADKAKASGDVEAVRTQLETIRRGKRDALDSFSVRVETSDKFGNEGDVPALSFSWAQADLDRVNWKGIADYQLLDLASVKIDHPNGVMALHDWCGPDGRTLTPRLCGVERARAENEWVARGN